MRSRRRWPDGRTYTIVEQLDKEGRILETARLMGGVEITEATKHHAGEMLALAEQKTPRTRHRQAIEGAGA